MKIIALHAARPALIVLILLAIRSAPASAHHSYSAFEMQGQKTITGTVKRFDWTNPHTWLWIDVPNEKGGVDTWGIEGMSPNYLGRRGWTKNTLKFGDKLTVTIHPLKDGSNGGSFVTAERPTGEKLIQTGQPTEP
jgi:hypothetical protein